MHRSSLILGTSASARESDYLIQLTSTAVCKLYSPNIEWGVDYNPTSQYEDPIKGHTFENDQYPQDPASLSLFYSRLMIIMLLDTNSRTLHMHTQIDVGLNSNYLKYYNMVLQIQLSFPLNVSTISALSAFIKAY